MMINDTMLTQYTSLLPHFKVKQHYHSHLRVAPLMPDRLVYRRSPLMLTAHMHGGLAVLSDRRWLSDEIRTLSFEYVHKVFSCSSSHEHSSCAFRDIYTFQAMNEHLRGARYHLIARQLPKVSTIPGALERMFCSGHSFYVNFFPYEST